MPESIQRQTYPTFQVAPGKRAFRDSCDLKDLNQVVFSKITSTILYIRWKG